MAKMDTRWTQERVMKASDDLARVMFGLGRNVYIKKKGVEEGANVILKSLVERVAALPQAGSAVYVDMGN